MMELVLFVICLLCLVLILTSPRAHGLDELDVQSAIAEKIAEKLLRDKDKNDTPNNSVARMEIDK